MADVSQLEVNGTTYNICDATARDSLSHVAEVIYPVGSIYMSTNSISPATLFGFGTWTRIEGKFLLGATDEATGSEASYVAGTTGGQASVTLTAAQSGVPAHNHGNTIKAATPQLSHDSITQPAFNTPELTHTVTQPTVKYTAPKSHTHNLSSAGYAYTSISATGSGYVTQWQVSAASKTYAAKAIKATEGYTENSVAHTTGAGLGGKTDSGACSDTTNGTSASVSGCAVAKHSATACTRSTNVAVGAHAATDCTMSGSVSNNTATDATSAHTNMPPFQAVYIWYRSA